MSTLADNPSRSAACAFPVLDNGRLRLRIGVDGTLRELRDLRDGHDYAGGRPLWRMFVRRGARFQEEMFAPETPGEATLVRDGEALVWSAPRLRSPAFGVLGLGLRITVTLHEDETRWDAELVNDTADITVRDFQFPLLGALSLRPGQALLTTFAGGQRHASPVDFVRGRFPVAHHWYVTNDHEALQVQHVYPGLQACANCFTLPAPAAGLYCGSHDPEFRETSHLWRVAPTDGSFECGFAKHLALGPGQRVSIEGYVVAAYAGSWHVAADKYRAWAETWLARRAGPEWLRGFAGWQRLIFKQQDGTPRFRYDDLPRIQAAGAAAGIPGLFMHAWWPEGHDHGYPGYRADSELGGEEALREQIRRFQAAAPEAAVVLYASGRLVDVASPFFRGPGRRLAIKTPSGEIHREFYNFGNGSTYGRVHGTVELSPMCLECPEWLDVLKGVVDLAADLGARAVFFDQLGLSEPPCHDPSHGHAVPLLSVAGKRPALEELREHARRRDPRLAVGVEVFCDVIADRFDFVHGWYGQGYLARNTDYRERGEPPVYPAFAEWMRYTFPAVRVSDRDIRDESDFQRLANHALLLGLLHDVEVFRCRETVDTMPRYQAWLAGLTGLRARHADLLAPGNYRDTLGFEADHPEVQARAFVEGGRMAVLLTQSHLPEVSTRLRVPGHRPVAWDRAGNAEVDLQGSASQETGVIRLPRHAVALVLFHSERS